MNSEVLAEGTLVYPRLTADYLQSLIATVSYSHVENARTTTCTVTTAFEFSISASVVCPNPELYDPEAGKRRALNKVLGKLRKLEYYVLRKTLYEEKQSHAGVV